MSADRPLDFLKEELESDQLAVRVNAVHRSLLIAALIGDKAVEKELIPFLDSLIPKEDDEVVYAIAKVLGQLFPTFTKKFQAVIPVLEVLASFEETVVRHEACESLTRVAEKLSEEDIVASVVPVVLRLAEASWFTNKISALHLICDIYEKTGEYKSTLRKKYKELCGDETPMIRRAVASGLGKLSHKMKTDMFVTDMLPVLKNLVNDDQDSVRILCIDSIVEISKAFTKDLNKSHIIPVLIHMIRDRAWKVRIKISNNFSNLAEAMSTDITDGSLLNIFSSLLSDPEGEVRTAATQNFAKFLKSVSPSKYSQLISLILDLTRDTLPQVRVAAFEIMATMARAMPKDEVKSKLVDPILSWIKTEQDNEVKIELLKALTACGVSMNSDFYAKLTNNDVANLLKEKNWRVRKEIYTMFAEVAVKIGSNQLFEVHFQEYFLSYLKDPVYQVRIHGNSLLPRILEIEPTSWVTMILIPRLQKLKVSEPNYLKKATALYAYETVVNLFPKDLQNPCLQEVYSHLNEKVPNIRIVALKVLHSVYGKVDDSQKQAIRSAAQSSLQDPDQDVRQQAQLIMAL